MKNIELALAAVIVLTTAAARKPDPPAISAAPVAAAERAFANDGAAMGVGPSFIKWSTDEAIVIGGGGVGKAHVEFAGPPAAGTPPLSAWSPAAGGIRPS